MKTVGIFALGLAVLAFAYATFMTVGGDKMSRIKRQPLSSSHHEGTEKDSLDNELAAALEAFIYSRGVHAGYLKRGDDGLGDDSVGDDDSVDDSLVDALDDEDGDDGDTDDDYDRRALLSTFEELALEARETKNALTEEEESLVNNLANLDDSTLKDLMDNIELLADDSEMSARSAKAKVASNLLISRLMSDHPDLQALVYGDEDSDAEDSAVLDRRNWFKNAWGNVKKVVDTLKKLWNKWMKKVTGWLIKAGKAQACAVCYNPIPAPGMSWSDFRTVKSKIESIACDICY